MIACQHDDQMLVDDHDADAGRWVDLTEMEVPEYIYHPTFSLPQTEDRLWGQDRERIAVPRYSLQPTVFDEDEQTRSVPRRLTKVEEKTLFLQYNYARYRLARLLTTGRRYGSRKEARANLWRGRALGVRETLVHANLPLVPSMARRSRVRNVAFSELVSEGYMAVLRSIEKFDVSRGFKFSTYACRAILSSFYRLGSKTHTYRKHVPVQFEPEMERGDGQDRLVEHQRDMAIDCLGEVMHHDLAALSKAELEVIRKRFGMDGRGRKTLSQVGQDVGLSNERVRQLQKSAISKLRDAIEEELTGCAVA